MDIPIKKAVCIWKKNTRISPHFVDRENFHDKKMLLDVASIYPVRKIRHLSTYQALTNYILKNLKGLIMPLRQTQLKDISFG